MNSLLAEFTLYAVLSTYPSVASPAHNDQSPQTTTTTPQDDFQHVHIGQQGQGTSGLRLTPNPRLTVHARNEKLATGQTMPQIQLGLYMMSGREATHSVRWALAAGYRGFDCAQMYHNEREAGRAIRDFLADDSTNNTKLTRADVHYTTKLASCSTDYDAVRRSIRRSVEACGLGWVDLMLLHSPYGGREARLASWRALEDAVEAGEVKMAGVSNFGVRHVSFCLFVLLGRRKDKHGNGGLLRLCTRVTD